MAVRCSTSWRLKPAFETDFLHGDAPHPGRAAHAIGRPPIDLIETFGAGIACKNPQACTAESGGKEMRAGRGYQGNSNAPAPLFRIGIERAQFSMVYEIRLVRWNGAGKPVNRTIFFRDKRVRLHGIEAGEVILPGAVFRTKLIEVIVRKECPVGSLPGPHMHTSHHDCIVWSGRADDHASVWHGTARGEATSACIRS